MTPEKAAENAAKVLDVAIDEADRNPNFVNAALAIADAWMRLHTTLAATGAHGERPCVCPPRTSDLEQRLQDAGEKARQALGIDGTMGDAQDVPHPYNDDEGAVPYCIVCGLADSARVHKHSENEQRVEIDRLRMEVARQGAIVHRMVNIPRWPENAPDNETGRAYTRGWQDARALVDKALLPEEAG